MSLDLDTIRVRLSRADVPSIIADAFALVGEVERLRAEVERRRDVYDLMGAVEHSANNLAAHEDMGALRERAAVIKYLAARGGICLDLADDIERGEHRREEK